MWGGETCDIWFSEERNGTKQSLCDGPGGENTGMARVLVSIYPET